MTPRNCLAAMTLLVDDYDRAINWFKRCLGFSLIQDVDLGDGKRWVTIAPTSDATMTLLLGRAINDEQRAQIGRQSGGRVFLFLHTTDFAVQYDYMKAQGVQFLESPRNEVYGTVVVFQDLYGNKWDLIEPCKDQESDND